MKPKPPAKDQVMARDEDPAALSRGAGSCLRPGFIAGLSCCVIVVAGVIGFVQQLRLRKIVQVTLSSQALVLNAGADIQVYALQCRRYEKDYFLNIADPKARAGYLKKWRIAWDRLSSHINQVVSDPGDALSIIDIDINAMRTDADSYNRLFLKIADRVEAGDIRDPSKANEIITPFKHFAREIITVADDMKETAGQALKKENGELGEQLTIAMVYTMFLVIVPSGLIVIAQLKYGQQIASGHQRLQEQNRGLARQEAETRKLAMVAAHTDNAVIITDADYRVEWINDSFTRITELPFAQVAGKTPDQILSNTDTDEATVKLVQEHLGKGRAFQVEAVGHTPSGRKYWLAMDAQPIRDDQGRVSNYVAVQRDITRQKQAEELLRHAAWNDQLTSLPNRAEIHKRISLAIDRRHREPGHKFALLFLDFDRFKIINDSLGHDVGDMLLVEIANRLRSYIKTNISVEPWYAARLGGDEFVLLMEGVSSLDEARTHASGLLESLARPYHLAGHEVRSTASIGIVLGDEKYERAEEVIRDADTAMYRAKASGKARAVPFDRQMHMAVQARQELETNLHHAEARGELTLEYQPIVSLESGAVVGFESLVRWDHRLLGRIMPSEFIHIAEETGLILSIGHWVLREACGQIARWRKAFPEATWTMNINLSRNQLMNPGLVNEVRSAIHDSGVDPDWLHLEITESSIMRDMDTALLVLNELKTIGVKIVMDDFGTGHSSLHCLQELPLDMLKIDRSFVSNMETNLVYPAIIQSIATLTHNMGIGLVAEGVETPQQVVQLQALECDLAQGYLFARPMPPKQCLEFIQRSIDGAIPIDLKRSA